MASYIVPTTKAREFETTRAHSRYDASQDNHEYEGKYPSYTPEEQLAGGQKPHDYDRTTKPFYDTDQRSMMPPPEQSADVVY